MPLDDADLAAPGTEIAVDASTIVDPAKPPPPPEPNLKSIEDLRTLNARATTAGMYIGVFGGGAMTFAAARLLRLSKNNLALTFILSSTGLSFLTARGIIRETLGKHHDFLENQKALPAPGGGRYFSDTAAGLDSGEPGMGGPRIYDDWPGQQAPSSGLAAAVEALGKRERTRWEKGKGLEGEVEEEAEMRDIFIRPGVPRREV